MRYNNCAISLGFGFKKVKIMQTFEVIVLDEARNSAGLGWRYFGEKILKLNIFLRIYRMYSYLTGDHS
jgi:hypothetical protein